MFPSDIGPGTDQDNTGLLIGLVIIGLGVTLLLDQEGVVRVWEVWRFWPLILVVVGLIRLLRARSTTDQMRSIVEILFGVVFQLGALGYKRFEVRAHLTSSGDWCGPVGSVQQAPRK